MEGVKVKITKPIKCTTRPFDKFKVDWYHGGILPRDLKIGDEIEGRLNGGYLTYKHWTGESWIFTIGENCELASNHINQNK